ncbi:MAG TPA: N-methyl-L-tryptophan oxidase, partial [Cytophagales bacterium]|nr:N-methyl-L-tryptophan oxidase [Cytophagales bacterium]
MVFDAIVIGVGSMGAATCYQLAKRGQRVLGLEQFGIVHDEGSHTGQSRIIRKAYFEHPDYVPLLESAYAGWQTLEEESGTQLYWPVGLAYFGEPGNPVLVEAQSSAQAYQLPLERKPPSYFPSFQLPTDWECWLEPEAGYLSPELAIRAFAQMAQHHGAEIRTQQRVMDLEVAGTEVVVRTEQEEFKARKLVITAGAFIKDLVNLSVPLQVTRQYLAWTETDPFGTPEAPCWVIAEPGTPGIYYGFPQTEHLPGPRGMKFGHHRPGDEWIPHLPDGIPAET